MCPSDFRDAPRPIRLTLLAVLCWVRTAELVDGLVDLLLGLVHKIDTRAETRVERELFGEWTRVRGKDAMLVRIATAATDRPDGTVREAIFPVAGEQTLHDVIREPAPISAPSRNASAPCCAAPTPATTESCSPSCWARWSSAATTLLTGRSWTPWHC